jgi:MFS family permease
MHGLYLLWWVEECRLSPALVAAVLAAGDLSLMVLEVPTGWLADRYGHRVSLVAGSLIQVLGMLCCWLDHGISGLVVGTLLIALGDSFRSGADEALLYRTCVALDRADAFQRIEGRTQALETLALTALVLVGGAIVTTWGFAAGWLAEAALCALGLLIACAMLEPPPAPEPEARAAPPTPRVLSARMFLLILPAAATGTLAGAGSFLAQTSSELTAASASWLVALMALAEAGGAALGGRLSSARAARTQQLLAVLGLALAALGLFLPSWLLWGAILLAALDGASGPLRAAAIQRLATDGTRAQAASLASACDMALNALLLPLAGLWRGR